MPKSEVNIISHPIVAEHLSRLRDKNTEPACFDWHLRQASKVLFLEVLSKAPIRRVTVETPLKKTSGAAISVEIALVAILRAGLGMVEGMREVFPRAKIGHIGIYRDEGTLKPVQYYFKIPKLNKNAWVFLIDPMLATGGSAIRAVDQLKKEKIEKIILISLIAAKKGINAFSRAHPEVSLYLAAIDESLNSQGFIVPGLGDCGDRQFGT